MGQARYASQLRRAASHSRERPSRERTAAADISDLFSHQVDRDRPLKGRPPILHVIAIVNSQERAVPHALQATS
eukprot:6208143-Pleurochrysis_carterae.AAC.2